uniref:RRM domain-containing protein n=1 Tax=Araucaria cunninghamii TaxID=56994 RepID=A0A0D6QWS3_ARACU
MGSALDMSLDDLIKVNKQSGRGGRGSGRGTNSTSTGPVRSRGGLRSANRATPYTLSKPTAPQSGWQHDMFDQQMTDAAPSTRLLKIETGTKVLISNLDYGVSNDDIKELFSEVGDLKRYTVHYDRSGRSKGTAEVVFARRSDGETAVKRYNNVQLDGKPLKLEIVGTNLAVPAPAQPRNVAIGNAIRASLRGRGRGGGAFRGSRGRGRGRGHRWAGGSGEEKSAEDLDAELESYHAEAMQTN